MERIHQGAALMADVNEHDGCHGTAIGGVYLTKHSPTSVPRTTLEQPVVCVVAPGVKSVR